jgi:hypothetical protein
MPDRHGEGCHLVTGVVIVGNRLLAARARELADQAPHGSLARKAALSAAVLLDETRSITAAGKLLGEIDPAIRQAAAEVLGQLANEPQE